MFLQKVPFDREQWIQLLDNWDTHLPGFGKIFRGGNIVAICAEAGRFSICVSELVESEDAQKLISTGIPVIQTSVAEFSNGRDLALFVEMSLVEFLNKIEEWGDVFSELDKDSARKEAENHWAEREAANKQRQENIEKQDRLKKQKQEESAKRKRGELPRRETAFERKKRLDREGVTATRSRLLRLERENKERQHQKIFDNNLKLIQDRHTNELARKLFEKKTFLRNLEEELNLDYGTLHEDLLTDIKQKVRAYEFCNIFISCRLHWVRYDKNCDWQKEVIDILSKFCRKQGIDTEEKLYKLLIGVEHIYEIAYDLVELGDKTYWSSMKNTREVEPFVDPIEWKKDLQKLDRIEIQLETQLDKSLLARINTSIKHRLKHPLSTHQNFERVASKIESLAP